MRYSWSKRHSCPFFPLEIPTVVAVRESNNGVIICSQGWMNECDEYRRGPCTEPWGTPEVTKDGIEMNDFIWIIELLMWRHHTKQKKTTTKAERKLKTLSRFTDLQHVYKKMFLALRQYPAGPTETGSLPDEPVHRWDVRAFRGQLEDLTHQTCERYVSPPRFQFFLFKC